MQEIVNSGRAEMTDYLQIDNQRIAYTITGSPANPPIIFVHGLMSHRGVWAGTIAALQENFYCIAFDLPGFGDSDKPQAGNYTIAKQAERVLQVADYFGIDQFIVVGHSMGGQISAYLTAALAPQRVRKLVFVDGVVTGMLSDHLQNITRHMVNMGGKFPALYGILRPLRNWKPYAYWAFQTWIYKIKEVPFDSWQIDRHYASDPSIAYSAAQAWAAVNATDLTPLLKNITAPTIVIFGDHDGTVPVEQAHLFKEKLPAAQLVLFDQCGHFPMYEDFDTYMKHLQEFLQ
jgi:pimeloyl-ACP methyl ester carboxylesterase